VETGRVIDGHYLLQRVVKQGQISTVYQGFDRKLQRVVAVKAVPAVHLPAYRAAARILSQFSHPNIIGLYDLFMEPEALYLVQEYVEGEDFAALLQAQLQPFDVISFGRQICLALIYAGSSVRRICHGDLTPAAVMRDSRGLVRINNFALPSDPTYFSAWSTIGGDGIAISDGNLPWGAESLARQSDDVRAVGLLLYQLLTVRPTGTTVIVPPQDGQLHFPRSVPRDVCEVIARAIIRQHPQHIKTAEVLHDELQILEELFEPPASMMMPDLGNAGNPIYAQPPVPIQFSPAAPSNFPAVNVNVLPGGQPGQGLSAYTSEGSSRATTAAPESNYSQTVSDSSLRTAAPTARRMTYPDIEPPPRLPKRYSPLLLLLIIGLVVFALFFIVGYFAGVFFVH
jgi:serine/threonine protein kinase